MAEARQNAVMETHNSVGDVNGGTLVQASHIDQVHVSGPRRHAHRAEELRVALLWSAADQVRWLREWGCDSPQLSRFMVKVTNHSEHPVMITDVALAVRLPDGSTASSSGFSVEGPHLNHVLQGYDAAAWGVCGEGRPRSVCRPLFEGDAVVWGEVTTALDVRAVSGRYRVTPVGVITLTEGGGSDGVALPL